MSFIKNYRKLVKHFGSQQKTADALGCSQPAVLKWLKGTALMSSAFANRAQAATNGKFKAIDLSPDIRDYQLMIDKQSEVENEING